jgi:hypothetical protein
MHRQYSGACDSLRESLGGRPCYYLLLMYRRPCWALWWLLSGRAGCGISSGRVGGSSWGSAAGAARLARSFFLCVPSGLASIAVLFRAALLRSRPDSGRRRLVLANC